jgi:hypothetical protein
VGAEQFLEPLKGCGDGRGKEDEDEWDTCVKESGVKLPEEGKVFEIRRREWVSDWVHFRSKAPLVNLDD